jgi:cell wall-associated NlpC family hydrolase
MAGEVTVKPEEQSGISRNVGNTLSGQGQGLSPSETAGIRPGHADALGRQFETHKAQYDSTSNLTGQGAAAATDIGQGDEESGKNIANTGEAEDGPDGKKGGKGDGTGDRANRPGKLSPDDINKLTNPKDAYRTSNPAAQTAPSGGGMPSGGMPSGGGMPSMPGGGAPMQSFLNSPPGANLLNSMLGSAKSGSGDSGPASLKMGERLPGQDGNVQDLAQRVVKAKIPYAWGGGGLDGPSRGIHDGGGAADAHGDYNKTGFDCSGLSRYIHYQLTGHEIPRTSEAQFGAGHAVSAANARPGDLVFPNNAGRPPHHVQVYLGNNQVIEAPSSGQLVKISALRASEFRRF